MPQNKFTNALIHESSPYLLQHAHNPVNWLPWGNAAFEKAKVENKLVLISIGYAACHWCHVMERESFENEFIAELMNANFVCIKVDREERPDVDMVYMSAVQLMTGRGGWPLNCFTLSDARPVYGGTYFNINQWQHVLKQLNEMHKNDNVKFETYAQELTNALKKSDETLYKNEPVKKEVLTHAVANWVQRFDTLEGGSNHAPKFPLPNNYQFLLRYATVAKNEVILEQVKLTLNKMANGGIYDQVGGGFARYSTDMLWKVPHFEKMLYDNAQLISLYSEAYSAFKNPLYKEVVYDTIAFLNRELKSRDGFYFSALDADSEGEEGKFYVWSKEQLNAIDFSVPGLAIDADKCSEIVYDYFTVNEGGLWEHGNYILLRQKSNDSICKAFDITERDLTLIIEHAKNTLLSERSKRIRPLLDDKSITSWNAMMITGLGDAYLVFNEQQFLEDAKHTAELIIKKIKQSDGSLVHAYKDGKTYIQGFLEDYCFVAEAFVKLYECTFEVNWLQHADELIKHVMKNFISENSPMFYFTGTQNENLILRKAEVQDNVIPASNSVLANVLFKLGKHFGNDTYLQRAAQMTGNVVTDVVPYASAYSNWCNLMLYLIFPFYEVVFTGASSHEHRKEFLKAYNPNCLIAGSTITSHLPLLANRVVENKSFIYLCENNTCRLPVSNVKDLKM